MAQFSDLPVETVSVIIEHVDPWDLLSFCLSCKTIHTLSAKRLTEDQELVKEYKEIWTTYDVLLLEPSSSGAYFLETCLEEPRIALCVRKFVLRGWEHAWGTGYPPYSASRMKLFRKAADKILIGNVRATCRKNFKIGEEAGVIALLLHVLPTFGISHLSS